MRIRGAAVTLLSACDVRFAVEGVDAGAVAAIGAVGGGAVGGAGAAVGAGAGAAEATGAGGAAGAAVACVGAVAAAGGVILRMPGVGVTGAGGGVGTMIWHSFTSVSSTSSCLLVAVR